MAEFALKKKIRLVTRKLLNYAHPMQYGCAFHLSCLFPTMVKLQARKETAKSGLSLREPQFINRIKIKTSLKQHKIPYSKPSEN